MTVQGEKTMGRGSMKSRRFSGCLTLKSGAQSGIQLEPGQDCDCISGNKCMQPLILMKTKYGDLLEAAKKTASCSFLCLALVVLS